MPQFAAWILVLLMDRSNRGGTRRCHEEVISTRDLQKAVDFVSGVAACLHRRSSSMKMLEPRVDIGGSRSIATGSCGPRPAGRLFSRSVMLMESCAESGVSALLQLYSGVSYQTEQDPENLCRQPVYDDVIQHRSS